MEPYLNKEQTEAQKKAEVLIEALPYIQTFNRKIEKSLRKTFKLWASFATNTTRPDMWREIDISFTPNLPRNIAEETSTAQAAAGLVSRRTRLGLLSYVPDPDAELDLLKKEETPPDPYDEDGDE